ncbi:MAG: Wzt carbohydrate-binding domain-containing protein [Fusicatenibacter saccharivorans]
MVEYGDKAAEIVDFAIIDHKGMITSSVDKNQRFRIKMKIKFHETMEHPIFAFSIKDRKGNGDYRNEYGAGGLHKRRGGSRKDRHGML